MKKIKIMLLGVIAISLGMVSCDNKDIPQRTDSPQVATGNQNVFFLSPTNQTHELELDVRSIELKLKRTLKGKAISVPIKVLKNDSNAFLIPKTVEFAAEDTIAKLVVTFPNALPAVKYGLDLAIDDPDNKFANPYSKEAVSTHRLSMLRIKWVKFADGEIHLPLFGVAGTEQALLRGEGTDKFRFVDLIAEGYPYDFLWDGKSKKIGFPFDFIVKNKNGDFFYKAETGYKHDKYGMLSFYTSIDEKTFYNGQDTIFFNTDYVVSAGPFGEQKDMYVIKKRFEEAN